MHHADSETSQFLNSLWEMWFDSHFKEVHWHFLIIYYFSIVSHQVTFFRHFFSKNTNSIRPVFLYFDTLNLLFINLSCVVCQPVNSGCLLLFFFHNIGHYSCSSTACYCYLLMFFLLLLHFSSYICISAIVSSLL